MNSLNDKVSAFVIDQFSRPVWKEYAYHNLDHTLIVVNECEHLAHISGLSDEKTATLILAAWFHDLGYDKGVEGHEIRSCKIARKFLKKQKAPGSLIDEVESLIKATHTSFERFQTLSQKIIRDADLSNAGLKGFRKCSDKLRREWAEKVGTNYTDKEWFELQFNYLSNLKYLTKAGKKKYNKRKKRNTKKYKKRAIQSSEAI